MTTYSVLVVDDEPDIRQVVSDILQDEGYEVTVAANAAATEDLRGRVDRFFEVQLAPR